MAAVAGPRAHNFLGGPDLVRRVEVTTNSRGPAGKHAPAPAPARLPAEMVSFAFEPMRKAAQPSKLEVAEPEFEAVPDVLPGLMMTFDWDEADGESSDMGWDMSESGSSSRPPRMDPSEQWGCSTTLVTAQSAEDAEDRIKTSLAIFESGNRMHWTQNSRWETVVGFTDRNRDAVITICLLNTDTNGTAIMFLCQSGDEYVFQTFYRKFTEVLHSNLPDVRSINHQSALPQQMEQMEFNMDGLNTSPKEVDASLAEVLTSLSSKYNSGTKSQRELTGTLVQIVQDNASSCADLSRQKNNNMARLVADVCTTMETCNGDTETTYNCIRVLHMLAGTECKTTFRWLKSRKAFDIIAQRLVDTLQREQATEQRAAQVKDGRQMKATRTDSIAPMMCSDMVGLLTIIFRNGGATAAGKEAITGVAFGDVPQQYEQVKIATGRLAQQLFS